MNALLEYVNLEASKQSMAKVFLHSSAGFWSRVQLPVLCIIIYPSNLLLLTTIHACTIAEGPLQLARVSSLYIMMESISFWAIDTWAAWCCTGWAIANSTHNRSRVHQCVLQSCTYFLHRHSTLVICYCIATTLHTDYILPMPDIQLLVTIPESH